MALLLDGLEGRSRAEIAAKLGISEPTVAGLLAQGRSNLRVQLEEGMTCERARQAVLGLSRDEIPRAQRRAALAHLRHCELCGAFGKPARSAFGLLGALWLGAGKLMAPGARFAPGTGGLAEAAASVGGTIAAKALLLAAGGTLVGGVAWDAAVRSDDAQAPGAGSRAAVAQPIATAFALPPLKRPNAPAEPAGALGGGIAAPFLSGAEATGSPFVVSSSTAAGITGRPPRSGPTPGSQDSSAGAGKRSLPATSGSDTDAIPSGTPATASELTDPAAATAQAPGDTGEGQAADAQGTPGGGAATAPDKLKQINSTTAGQTTAPGLQKTTDSPGGQAAASGQHRKGATGGKTDAPGAQKQTAGVVGAGATPQAAQGQVAEGEAGAAQATARGRQNDPGEGNRGGGQTTAPGQETNLGQGDSGGGQATALGRQNDPGDSNSGGGHTTGQQANLGGGEPTALGQQNDPGAGNPGGGQTTAPGQQVAPGQGAVALREREGS
jgi:hypothetical protein